MPTAYDPEIANYSHGVVEIRPGSVVRGCNFCQVVPNTQAIVCDGDLTLIECNLVNCALDPRWTAIDSNTAQLWYVSTTTASSAFDPAEVDRLRVLSDLLTKDQWDKIAPEYTDPPSEAISAVFVASHPSRVSGDLVPPDGAIRSAVT